MMVSQDSKYVPHVCVCVHVAIKFNVSNELGVHVQ